MENLDQVVSDLRDGIDYQLVGGRLYIVGRVQTEKLRVLAAKLFNLALAKREEIRESF